MEEEKEILENHEFSGANSDVSDHENGKEGEIDLIAFLNNIWTEAKPEYSKDN